MPIPETTDVGELIRFFKKDKPNAPHNQVVAIALSVAEKNKEKQQEKKASLEKSAIAKWKAVELAKNLYNPKIKEYVGRLTPSTRRKIESLVPGAPKPEPNFTIRARKSLAPTNVTHVVNPLSVSSIRNFLRDGIPIRGAYGKQLPRVNYRTNYKTLENEYNLYRGTDGQLYHNATIFPQNAHPWQLPGRIVNKYTVPTEIPYRGDPALLRGLSGQFKFLRHGSSGNTPVIIKKTTNQRAGLFDVIGNKILNSRSLALDNGAYIPGKDVVILPSSGLQRANNTISPVVDYLHNGRGVGISGLSNFRAVKEHETGHRNMSYMSPGQLDLAFRNTLAPVRKVLRQSGTGYRLNEIGENKLLEGVNNYLAANPGSELRNVYVNRYDNTLARQLGDTGNWQSSMSPDRVARTKAALEQLAANYQGVHGLDVFPKSVYSNIVDSMVRSVTFNSPKQVRINK